MTAPPVPRLFARTPYGTSVWSRFLFKRYACLRPLHRVCGWLWISVGRGAAYFHVDPSRSAEAARKLFDGALCPTVLVCDRYSGYKKLARLLGGRVTLSFCWAHMRRDFIRCAAGHVHLTGWCREWLGRIATVYRLHKARLELHDPGLERQSPAFDAAHDALSEALGGMFAASERQLARLSPKAREGGPLRSLLNHREGLSVFLDRPRVPLDNNLADWLAACARGGGRPPGDLSPWLPWSMDAGPPALNRHALSKEFCRRIGWFKPDGGLKDMMARVTMLAMHSDGLIVLPPPKWKQNRPGPIVFGQDTEPPLFPPPTILNEVRPLELRTVVGGTRQGRLWNEFVARHHYLGYKTLVGAQMRYAVHDRNGWPLAMLGFSTAAWSLAPRDRFIGWTPTLRKKNLPLVIDNPRFLILPWIRIPNLGSHILALVRRRLPRDWTRRYNTTPVLIETFVEVPRFTGGVYRASGWIRVGTTRGRGRYDTAKQYGKPTKDVWLRPLAKHWKRILNR